MSRFSRITETVRREAAKPENQRRARELMAKFRSRRQQPPTR